jgi:hypothetical protein
VIVIVGAGGAGIASVDGTAAPDIGADPGCPLPGSDGIPGVAGAVVP